LALVGRREGIDGVEAGSKKIVGVIAPGAIDSHQPSDVESGKAGVNLEDREGYLDPVTNKKQDGVTTGSARGIQYANFWPVAKVRQRNLLFVATGFRSSAVSRLGRENPDFDLIASREDEVRYRLTEQLRKRDFAGSGGDSEALKGCVPGGREAKIQGPNDIRILDRNGTGIQDPQPKRCFSA
jgi:hypothetical protein